MFSCSTELAPAPQLITLIHLIHLISSSHLFVYRYRLLIIVVIFGLSSILCRDCAFKKTLTAFWVLPSTGQWWFFNSCTHFVFDSAECLMCTIRVHQGNLNIHCSTVYHFLFVFCLSNIFCAHCSVVDGFRSVWRLHTKRRLADI